MKKTDLLAELLAAERRDWFVQRLAELEQTDDMLKARLEIQPDLFVQVYFSESSGRLQMALIQGRQRLFGKDNEGGQWHAHPYGAADRHLSIAAETSPQPLARFLAEVEQILMTHDLI